MMRYLAVLGQNPELSLAELQAVYPKIKIITRSNETVIFDSAEKIDLGRLGGTPKLAEILAENIAFQNVKDVVLEELKKLDKERKIFFGLSFYGNSDRKKYERLGKEIKNALKDAGRKARWANSRELALSSVYIKTNKLLTRGFDFDLVFNVHASPPFGKGTNPTSPPFGKGGLGGISIFKTVAVQNFADYEFRDIRRPARDLVSGMTPPKLAKIMINLASPPFEKGLRLGSMADAHCFAGSERRPGGIFLDPFCGSGTFLAEAALLGYKNICGSDIAEKAVSNSQKNFSWLKEKYNLPQDAKIKLCDIKNISTCWDNKFNSIATEPYLGPPVRGKLSPAQAEKIKIELSGLYEIYLKNLSTILDKNGTLVLIVPFFFVGENTLKINLELKKAGLQAVRPPILYSRPDQKVGREIYILRKILTDK